VTSEVDTGGTVIAGRLGDGVLILLGAAVVALAGRRLSKRWAD
jgi:hypothetical protein